MAYMTRLAFSRSGVAELTAEGAGDDLPGDAPLVLKADAIVFPAAAGDELVPVEVDLFWSLHFTKSEMPGENLKCGRSSNIRISVPFAMMVADIGLADLISEFGKTET